MTLQIPSRMGKWAPDLLVSNPCGKDAGRHVIRSGAELVLGDGHGRASRSAGGGTHVGHRVIDDVDQAPTHAFLSSTSHGRASERPAGVDVTRIAW